jgi:pyruvate,water dikinase
MSQVALREANDLSLYGGKAVALGALLRAELPVPRGFALSWQTVEAIARGDAAAMAGVRELPRLLGGPVAVRSSAIGEDSAEASFAGQHSTKLNAHDGHQAVEAVIAVRDSGRSEAALAYRRKLGIPGDPRVAVVVQRMLAPECAGVLFTRCPISGRDERVIEAAWGLGEVVVGGLVTPDRYRVARGGAVLERAAGTKDIAILANASGGTEEIAIDPARAAALCLSDARLAELDRLAARCESTFGGQQDIEWAVAEGALWALQSRAVTR